ncbi:MAG: hypothetical protein QXO21_05445 [Candidatus Anstonellales archaeon]
MQKGFYLLCDKNEIYDKFIENITNKSKKLNFYGSETLHITCLSNPKRLVIIFVEPLIEYAVKSETECLKPYKIVSKYNIGEKIFISDLIKYETYNKYIDFYVLHSTYAKLLITSKDNNSKVGYINNTSLFRINVDTIVINDDLSFIYKGNVQGYVLLSFLHEKLNYDKLYNFLSWKALEGEYNYTFNNFDNYKIVNK